MKILRNRKYRCKRWGGYSFKEGGVYRSPEDGKLLTEEGYLSYTLCSRELDKFELVLEEGDKLTVNPNWRETGNVHGWKGCGSIRDIEESYMPTSSYNNITFVAFHNGEVIVRHIDGQARFLYKELFNETKDLKGRQMKFKLTYACPVCGSQQTSKEEPEVCENKSCKSNIPVYEYPLYKRANRTGFVYKFTELNTGEIVMTSSSIGRYKLGYKTDTVYAHTDKTVWEDVEYNRELNLYDTQPVICWDERDKTARAIKFYDGENLSTFSYSGKRSGYKYENIEPYPTPYPDFILEMYAELKV